jgi:hypothetical protein
MTMEEHCPHGKPNAVFCAECEREDRARIARQYKARQLEQERRKEWKELTRGLPAYVVARILNRHTPSTSWTGSSKSDMAEAWASPRCEIQLVDRESLRKELRDAPRETSAEKAARKEQRELAQRAGKIVAYLQERTPDRLGEAMKTLRDKDIPASVLGMALEKLRALEQTNAQLMRRYERELKETIAACEAIESLLDPEPRVYSLTPDEDYYAGGEDPPADS